MATTEVDKLEYTTLKCILSKNYDELFKLFGYDRKKILYDVECYTGRKTQQPQATEKPQIV